MPTDKLAPGLHLSITGTLCCPACEATTSVDPQSPAEALIWICLVCGAAWRIDASEPPTKQGTTAIFPVVPLNIPPVRPEPS